MLTCIKYVVIFQFYDYKNIFAKLKKIYSYNIAYNYRLI